MKKFEDAQDDLVKQTKGDFKEDVVSDKIVADAEKLLESTESTDMTLKCDLKTAEKAKFKLMNKGYQVQIYEELKELHLGIWK